MLPGSGTNTTTSSGGQSWANVLLPYRSRTVIAHSSSCQTPRAHSTYSGGDGDPGQQDKRTGPHQPLLFHAPDRTGTAPCPPEDDIDWRAGALLCLSAPQEKDASARVGGTTVSAVFARRQAP